MSVTDKFTSLNSQPLHEIEMFPEPGFGIIVNSKDSFLISFISVNCNIFPHLSTFITDAFCLKTGQIISNLDNIYFQKYNRHPLQVPV